VVIGSRFTDSQSLRNQLTTLEELDEKQKMADQHIEAKVVYCVVTEANPGIMSCRQDTYPSRHYTGCCLYPDGLEFYRIFLYYYITPFRTHRIYDVHV
jgi:hypothetical protein